jgi:hypothetical protein
MNTYVKGFLLAMLVLVSLAVCGCDEPPAVPAPTPAPTADTLLLEQALADFGVYDVPATSNDVAASRATLDFAADALQVGEKTMLLDTLSANCRQRFQSVDLAGIDAAGLSAALRSASLSYSRSNAIVYVTTVRGQTYEVPLVKEEGSWKIAVL